MPSRRGCIIDEFASAWAEHLTAEVHAVEIALTEVATMARRYPLICERIREGALRLSAALSYTPPTRRSSRPRTRRRPPVAANH